MKKMESHIDIKGTLFSLLVLCSVNYVPITRGPATFMVVSSNGHARAKWRNMGVSTTTDASPTSEGMVTC